MSDLSNPLTRIESYLAGIAGVLEAVPDPPLTRIEEYLESIYGRISEIGQATLEAAAENLAAEYDPEAAYAVGDYCTHDGILYVCNTAIAEPGEDWTAEHWTEITVMEAASTDEWEEIPLTSVELDSAWTLSDIKGTILINEKRKLLYLYVCYSASPGTNPAANSKLLTIGDERLKRDSVVTVAYGMPYSHGRNANGSLSFASTNSEVYTYRAYMYTDGLNVFHDFRTGTSATSGPTHNVFLINDLLYIG